MKVIFKPEAFQKLRAYINSIDYEISGFGKVEKVGEDLVVTDVKIFQQVVSETHTTMDAMALAAFWDELMVAGEDIGKWKLWWHSHVNMPALFSGTDYDTIDEFDTELGEENWILAIVANKLGKMLARVDIFQPIRCTINDLSWDIEVGNVNMITDVTQEIMDKVTIRTHKATKEEVKSEKISFFGPRIPIFPTKESVLSPEDRINLIKKYPHLASQLTLPEKIEEGIIVP